MVEWSCYVYVFIFFKELSICIIAQSNLLLGIKATTSTILNDRSPLAYICLNLVTHASGSWLSLSIILLRANESSSVFIFLSALRGYFGLLEQDWGNEASWIMRVISDGTTLNESFHPRIGNLSLTSN